MNKKIKQRGCQLVKKKKSKCQLVTINWKKKEVVRRSKNKK